MPRQSPIAVVTNSSKKTILQGLRNAGRRYAKTTLEEEPEEEEPTTLSLSTLPHETRILRTD